MALIGSPNRPAHAAHQGLPIRQHRLSPRTPRGVVPATRTLDPLLGVVKVTGFTDALDDTPARKRRLRGKCAPLRQCDRASLLVNLPGDEMPLLIEMDSGPGVN